MNKQVGKENDWLCGASVVKAAGKALRYFKNPTADGSSIDHASNYNDSLNVHFTSGVYNKAFYLLATKPNWDIKKAFGLFLTANQVYWEKEATFNSAACGVVKAANDLKYEVSDIISSFKEVGVNANCSMPDPGNKDETPITNGTVINNIKIASGDEHRYVINVPVVRTFPYGYSLLYVRVYNSKGTAKSNAELYIRYEDGTVKKMDKTEKLAGDEIFSINKPAAGNYHLLLKGKNPDTVNLSAFYGNF